MTKRDLLKLAKLRIGKLSRDILDKNIEQLINVGLTDLKRIGVDISYLDDLQDPLLTEAVMLYCVANYGTPPNQEKLQASYEMMCTKIKTGGYHANDN